MSPCDDALFMARVAKSAERWDDMVKYVSQAVEAEGEVEIDSEERGLISTAFSRCIGGLRASWRVLCSAEQKESHVAHLIREYRARVETELVCRCKEALAMIKAGFIPKPSPGEKEIFYYKTIGDYYRYIAELAPGDEQQQAFSGASSAYQQAAEAAEKSGLSEAHPTRLGLVLNSAVFYHELMGLKREPCDMIKQALITADTSMDRLREQDYVDSAQVVMLLRQNYENWYGPIGEFGDAPWPDENAHENP